MDFHCRRVAYNLGELKETGTHCLVARMLVGCQSDDGDPKSYFCFFHVGFQISFCFLNEDDH